ncbi:MAG TPA: hypothetical protein VHL14_11950 [Steroidobacteraceae bacterium]|nr:hypothetical protein [Steroidobacteraceae bacterium]
MIKKILLGGFSAGLADFLYATINTVVAGGSWMRPWKGVAGGLLGRAALDGGMETVITGIALHFFICFVAAALLYVIASRVKWLPRQWIILGILYGVAFLAVMNYVILPLSAIGRGIYPFNKIYITVFFHILLVGWPTAFFISRALKRGAVQN